MSDMQKQLMELMEKAELLRKNMEDAQKNLGLLEVTGSAGAGSATVKITINGQNNFKKVEISQDAYREGRTILADLVTAAANDAVRKIEKAVREKMEDITKGLNLPEDFGGLGGLGGLGGGGTGNPTGGGSNT